MKRFLASCLLISCYLQTFCQNRDISIIPRPQTINCKEGFFFNINSSTSLVFDNCYENDIKVFINQLRKATGFKLSAGNGKPHNSMVFSIDSNMKLPHADGYSLTANDKQVHVKARSAAGLFYACQSLRQLLPPAIESNKPGNSTKWNIPQVNIIDYPRFNWRGYMKDVSRTFYSIDVIKKYLDVMALYKLNVFHLHLTDDQGWRIEIKKYPGLTSAKTTVFDARHDQPAERSGFYTQEQIKDLIEYAAARYIEIVPEIDVPGHCWPVILVKPELGVNKTTSPQYVFPFNDSWSYWGYQYTPNPLDPANEEVYTFLNDIFSEVARLFPSKYLHFGGDEVVHRLWENEPHIKKYMKDKELTKVEQLQSYFVNRVCELIIKQGKQPIGWNDILADAEHLPKEITVMSWLGNEAVKEAAKNKFYTVATPASPLYFDITQNDRNDGTMSDLNYENINSMDRVYNYDPEEGLTDQEKKYVLGVQANLWSAVPQEVKDVNVQNFPRLLALAETAWTINGNKNFNNFVKRLDLNYARLDSLKIDYYKTGGYIVGHWNEHQITKDFKAVQWEVTEKVYANGRILAGFFFTKGESFLKVKNVQLLEDGKIISSDVHSSVADNFRGLPFKKNMFIYALKVDNYNPKARYILQAEVAGDTNTNSEGNVTFNLSPYIPFSAIRLFGRL